MKQDKIRRYNKSKRSTSKEGTRLAKDYWGRERSRVRDELKRGLEPEPSDPTHLLNQHWD